MVQDWMFSAIVVLLGIACLYLWGARRRIEDLEYSVNELKSLYDKMLIGYRDVEKKLNEHQGTMHVCSSSLSKEISEIKRKLAILSFVPKTEEYNSVSDEENEDAEPELWAGVDKLDTIDEKPKPDVSLKWTYDGEILGYRWIFPSKEKCIPIYGQRYMVVGVLHGHETMEDGSPFICTEEATWDSYKFVTDKEEHFAKVYAYIRIPDSSDIMKSIIEITLHENEG